MENNDVIKIRVSYNRKSDTSYGCFVNVILDEKGRYSSGSQLEWFPIKLCSIETVEPDENPIFNYHYLNCPKWLLDKKKINYEGKSL